MKVQCLQENLARGLGVVNRVVKSKSTLPVLGNVLLEARDNGQLWLTGTNLEQGIRCRVGAKVEEPGSTTLPARLLSDFVNSLPPEVVSMVLDGKTETMALHCARFDANIKGIAAEEFVIVPEPEGEPLVSMAADKLKQAIEYVAFAAATDEARPILQGVLMQFEGERLTLAAADGFRLSVHTDKLARTVGKAVEAIVPARSLKEAARIASDEEVDIYVTPEMSKVMFSTPDVTLVSQLIEGRFPDYRQIIPESHATRTTVERAGWLTAARVAHLFAGDAANILRLAIEVGAPGTMTLTATSPELGDNESQLDATVDGDGIEIAFDSRYLIAALDVMGNGRVMLETTDAASPGVLRPEDSNLDFVHVLMPMHLGR